MLIIERVTGFLWKLTYSRNSYKYSKLNLFDNSAQNVKHPLLEKNVMNIDPFAEQ